MNIPQLVKQAVHTVAPTADVILYGSRARGDFDADSDWDFLVLTDEPFSWDLKLKIHDAVFEIIYDTNETIFCVVEAKSEWNTPLSKADPFHSNVIRDGQAV